MTTVRLEALAQDIRYALRTLLGNPGFTAAAVLMLAAGIGVNTAVFTVASGVLSRGFRLVEQNDRLLYLDTVRRGRGCCVSYPDYRDWRAQSRSFEDIGAVADQRISLSDATGAAESYTATRITANTFRLLRQQPVLGRDFTPADELPGAPRVAILTNGLWQRRFGGDRTIVGRTVRIDGEPATVIGVMPRGFAFPQNQDLWIPLVPTPELDRRDARTLWFAFGRLADSSTTERARAEMATIGSRLATGYPATNEGFTPNLRTFDQFYLGPNAATIYRALWGAVAFVLLIACANVANLLLSRAIGRSREISLRLALGAGRWRIVRQLLIESALLALAAGCLGWWIASLGVHAYELSANPPTLSWSDQIFDYSMDTRVLAYLMAISAAAGLLFGLAPALRLASLDINAMLREGGRGTSAGRRNRRLSMALVSGEVALAVILLAGAGVMIRSFVNVYSGDLGFKPANVLTLLINLPIARYETPESQVAFFDRLSTRLASVPGVESIAVATGINGGLQPAPFEVAGAPVEGPHRPTLSLAVIGDSYFRTIGTPIISGREFTSADGTASLPVVIVNQRFAEQYWPGDDPLGQRIRLSDRRASDAWLTVVGVAANVTQTRGGLRVIEPIGYVPYRQRAGDSMWVFARTSVPPASLAAAVRGDVHAIDAELPVWLGPFPLTDRLAASYWNQGLYGALFLAFAAIALLLASIGLYAMVAHSVSQRTQEIGIRMAVGATAGDILRSVFAQASRPVVLGLAAGLAGAFALNRLLTAALVGVTPADPLALTVAALVLIAAATLGCLLPARRAMQIDPVIALRHQ